jgi:C1A family cysteine protease
MFLSDIVMPVQQSVEFHTKEAHPIVGDIDWAAEGKVSPIKNQGSCGSGWAFSTTGLMESQAIINGKNVNLS